MTQESGSNYVADAQAASAAAETVEHRGRTSVAVGANGGDREEWRMKCTMCGALFSSRNALFRHLWQARHSHSMQPEEKWHRQVQAAAQVAVVASSMATEKVRATAGAAASMVTEDTRIGSEVCISNRAEMKVQAEERATTECSVELNLFNWIWCFGLITFGSWVWKELYGLRA